MSTLPRQSFSGCYSSVTKDYAPEFCLLHRAIAVGDVRGYFPLAADLLPNGNVFADVFHHSLIAVEAQLISTDVISHVATVRDYELSGGEGQVDIPHAEQSLPGGGDGRSAPREWRIGVEHRTVGRIESRAGDRVFSPHRRIPFLAQLANLLLVSGHVSTHGERRCLVGAGGDADQEQQHRQNR
jgi:hypothetical protein